jgi:hypothetical protein
MKSLYDVVMNEQTLWQCDDKLTAPNDGDVLNEDTHTKWTAPYDSDVINQQPLLMVIN